MLPCEHPTGKNNKYKKLQFNIMLMATDQKLQKL